MNWKAVSFVYISTVGSGKNPSIPKIGIMSNADKITFMIVLIVFMFDLAKLGEPQVRAGHSRPSEPAGSCRVYVLLDLTCATMSLTYII